MLIQCVTVDDICQLPVTKGMKIFLTSVRLAGGVRLLRIELKIRKLILNYIWSDQHSPVKKERVIFISFLEEDLTIS